MVVVAFAQSTVESNCQDNTSLLPELVRFEPFATNPIFTTAPGQWDAYIRERGWIMKDGDMWKLWHTGYANPQGTRLLGYATSKDGLSWTRHPGNPIYKAHWVEDMMVVKEAGKYWMFAEGKDDQAHLLVSTDGVDWKSVGPLDIRKKSGEPIEPGPYGTPTAFKQGDTWHLFYERSDLGIWLADSKDMKVWTHVKDESVLNPGPGEYDKDLIAMNQVIKHKGRYYAYYHGRVKTGPNAKLWSTGIATSKDLLTWEKYAGNPLLPVKQNKSSGIVVPDTLFPGARICLTITRNWEKRRLFRAYEIRFLVFPMIIPTRLLTLTILAAITSIATAADPARVPRIPVLEGDPWRICTMPDLGDLKGPNPQKQHIVDHSFIQDSKGTWRLWACIRGTAVGRVIYGWEGTSLNQGLWREIGIVLRADADRGESKTDKEERIGAPHFLRVGNTWHCFYHTGDPAARGKVVHQRSRRFSRNKASTVAVGCAQVAT